MSQKQAKTSAPTSKGTARRITSMAKRPASAPRAVGARSSSSTERVSRSPSGSMQSSATGVLPLRTDLTAHQRSRLTFCRVCKLPSVLHEWRRVKSRAGAVDHVSIPAQGPETQPHVKRWCAGSCMAIMAVIGMAYMDLVEELADLKTTREGKRCLTSLKKKFHWLAKEVNLDLKIRGRNRDFTGVR